MTDLPEGWQPPWANEEHATIMAMAGEILRNHTDGRVDLSKESDPLIDQPMIAALAGVRVATVYQWVLRTDAGLLDPPFPQPDDDRYKDKPQYRLSTVLTWLWPKRWPPGASGRPESRGPRKARRNTAQDLADDGGQVTNRAA